MKATIAKCLLFLLICCNFLVTKAQPDLSKFEIGINGGKFIYQGDLTPSRLVHIKHWNPAWVFM